MATIQIKTTVTVELTLDEARKVGNAINAGCDFRIKDVAPESCADLRAFGQRLIDMVDDAEPEPR
jgi:hypothetical protein